MVEGKPGWKRWRFDQIAFNVTNRVDDPGEAGVEYYIGLEHLDSDCLRVLRWGSPADVSATKLLFEPGDIIFGRRRAYQRKLGVAEFRGIASAHSLVLRARPDVALSGFLPFFMQSDVFMERAQQISVGSLSPTINWKTLAKQKFVLPPLDEQRRVLSVLRHVESTEEAHRKAHVTAKSLYDAGLFAVFSPEGSSGNDASPRGWCPAGWEVVPLGQLTSSGSPVCYGIVQPGASVQDGVPTVSSNNLNVGFEDDIHYTAREIERKYARSRIEGGDVLVTVKGFGTGNIAIVPSSFKGNITRDVARVRLGSEVDARYFRHLWSSGMYERYWRIVSVGTTRPELSIGKLRAMQVPWPTPPERQRVTDLLDELEDGVHATARSWERTRTLRKVLVETVLAGSHP